MLRELFLLSGPTRGSKASSKDRLEISVFESIAAEFADLGYDRTCVSKLSLSTDFP